MGSNLGATQKFNVSRQPFSFQEDDTYAWRVRKVVYRPWSFGRGGIARGKKEKSAARAEIWRIFDRVGTSAKRDPDWEMIVGHMYIT